MLITGILLTQRNTPKKKGQLLDADRFPRRDQGKRLKIVTKLDPVVGYAISCARSSIPNTREADSSTSGRLAGAVSSDLPTIVSVGLDIPVITHM